MSLRILRKRSREEESNNVNPWRPFPMYASFSHAEYYDRTDARNKLRKMRSLAFCREPPTFTKTDSARQLRWWLLHYWQPTPLKQERLPNGSRIHQVTLLRLWAETMKASRLGLPLVVHPIGNIRCAAYRTELLHQVHKQDIASQEDTYSSQVETHFACAHHTAS